MSGARASGRPAPIRRRQRGYSRFRNQGGYLLLAVAVTLAVIAAAAFLINRESALHIQMSSGGVDATEVDYVAQAGLHHAIWQTNASACAGDITIPSTAFGPHSYDATITAGGTTTGYELPVDQDTWIKSDDPTADKGSLVDQHVRFESGVVEQALFRFDLSPVPAGAQINSATAWFYVESGQPHPEGPITIHRVTADWTETGANWETLDGQFDSQVLATIPAQAQSDVWVRVNLTAQVQAWVNGQPNYGILFSSSAEGIHGRYISREGAAGQQPRLDVIVGTGPATPATITATGTLTGNPSPANDITRTLTRIDAPAYQPGSYTRLQPGAASGKDAEIWDQAPNNNYGNSAETWVSSASNDTTRTLLRFNMGEIPVGARILAATLSLNRQSGSGADQPVSAHRIRNPWSEDSVTWNIRESGTNWDTAGGDFDNTAVATTPVGPANQRYEWNITPLVQGWVDGSYPNYGVALTAAIAGMPGERFNTSDHADPSLWPSLSITYTCECGSVCMATQGTGRVLLVVVNPTTLVAADAQKKALIESWGYTVEVISESANQSAFDAAVANNDVVYISNTVNSNTLGTKLVDAPIGVVTEDGDYNADFGIATGAAWTTGNAIEVIDNSHYITLPFPAGPLEIYSAEMEGLTVSGSEAPGLQTLADRSGVGTLVALDQGAQMTSGGSAAGRRVMLPLGRSTTSAFTWDYLNNNGRLIVQRAIAWGMKADVGSAGNVLLVVGNPSSLTAQEDAKKALMESWNFTVNLIDESDSQANFDAAIAANDVAYIPQDITSSNLGTKLTNATIGVVNEEGEQVDELGFSQDKLFKSRHEIDVVDNSHYITQLFATGFLTFVSSDQSVHMLSGQLAPGLQTLGQTLNTGSQYKPSLGTLDAGAELSGGGSAAGRRVQLPWGGGTFDINLLTDNGRTIMRRALEWGAGLGTGPTGPLAHWKLDESSGTTAADSVGGHDGTLVSNPAWVAGTLDGGLDLDGVDDYVDVGTFDVSGSGLTLMGWFNAETIPTSDGRIVSKASGPNDYDAWWQLSTTDSGSNRYIRMRIKAGSTTTTLADSSVNLTTGQWYFAVATYENASGEMKLYLDGTEVASGIHAVGGPVDTDAAVPVAIGANGTAERFFDGTLDDVRVYNRALSAAEIAELAAPPSLGPVAHWKLDETSGTTAIDSAGGHDGTLTNGPTWGVGTIDGGVSFDGSNDFVNVTHDSNLSLTTFSISAWIRPTALSGWQIVVNKGTASNAVNYYLATNGDEIGLGFYNAGWVEFNTTGANLSTDQWYHVAATFDDSTGEGKIYLDGAPIHTSTTTKSPLPNSDALTIGRSEFGEYWSGMLDDVRIYDRVLDALEVADLAAAGGGGGGPGPGTVVYEAFEELIDADNNSASISVSKPAGTADGDLLIAVVVVNRNNESSLVADDPSWTLLTRDRQANAMTVGVWWKVAGGSEPSSYGFSWGSGARSYSWIMRFSGNDPTNPINVWAKFGEGGTLNPLSPAVTTTVDDTLILRIGGFDDDDITIGDPGMAGHTPITMQKSNTGTGTVSGGAAYVDQAASGNSGTANFTLTASEQSRTITIGIAPAP